MSVDLAALAQALDQAPVVARVVVAEIKGSAPREPGAAMLVWPAGQAGTIGGGALEYTASQSAQVQIAAGTPKAVHRAALGPHLGQCCGGAVTLVTELWDRSRLAALPAGPVVRRIEGDREMPLAMRAGLRTARATGHGPELLWQDGWLLEPRTVARRALWLYGAGHVGRALVDVLAPVPGLAITWVDTGPERFPATVPPSVTVLPAAEPARTVPHAPADADHLVLTYSHAIDLALCHALCTHGFGSAGVIGSATKWARFRTKLRQLGHNEATIARIACPIGDPALGKHPQVIAVGVAAALLRHGRWDSRDERRTHNG